MLLAREFLSYLSRQLVRRLTPVIFETTDPSATAETIAGVISYELEEEDRLNDEVRDILDQHTELMRQENMSYHELFRRAKNTLIAQRKIVRASGRDSGDQMKLSRDKVNDLSHKLMNALRVDRNIRIKKPQNEVRLQLVQQMTAILLVEEQVDKAARAKVRSQKKDMPEGTEEWDLLHRRYYAEELKKLGIDLGR